MKPKKLKFKTNFACKFLLVLGLFFFVPQQAEAQFFKKLAKKAKAKIEREAEKRSERRVNKKIDKQFDKAEDALDGKKKESKQSKNNKAKNEQREDSNESNKPTVVWSKFDFIPGDTIIFEDGPSEDEENGEFPSRWDLEKGQVEIAEVDGEKVIMFVDGGMIVPYLKNNNQDYLPDVFTVEFDFYRPKKGNRVTLYLKDIKNQDGDYQEFEFTPIRVNPPVGGSVEHSSRDFTYCEEGCWTHVSLAFTKGKLKVYIDDARLINIPHYEFNPSGITLQAYWADASENKAFYFKNIRIAKGGVKYYDRVLSEGKIIVNGIKFDTNKATLKPESMGPINKIYELMQKQPDLNFSVEGHTDDDGNDDNNQTLSEARGKSVMNKLIEMGISPKRLKSTGFGESKSLDTNSTPEGKANNRRVEFVKFAGESTPNRGNIRSGGTSEFDKLDRKLISTKLESLPNERIQTSNFSGIVNGKGTVIIYATSEGYLGKMEILEIDKSDNYKLKVKYVTYKYDGSIHSQSNHLEIKSTYTCDLDKGKSKNVEQYEEDFLFKKEDAQTTSIWQSETSILRIYK